MKRRRLTALAGVTLAAGVLSGPASADSNCSVTVCASATIDSAVKTACGPKRADGNHVCGWYYGWSYLGAGLVAGHAHADFYVTRDYVTVKTYTGDCTWDTGQAGCAEHRVSSKDDVLVADCDEPHFRAYLYVTATNQAGDVARAYDSNESIVFDPNPTC